MNCVIRVLIVGYDLVIVSLEVIVEEIMFELGNEEIIELKKK